MKGTVYKITNTVNNYVYFGSTKQKLSRRMATHRASFKSGKSNKLYDEMRKIGLEHFKIVWIEDIEYENIYELRRREDDYIKQHKSSLNTYNAVGINRNKAISTIGAFKIYKKEINKKECVSMGEIKIQDIDKPTKCGYMLRCQICNTLLNSKAEIKRHYKSKKHDRKSKMFTEFKFNEVVGELHQLFN
jgi:group I intron endonuclease